jgi:peptide/nickel transport system permease protein
VATSELATRKPTPEAIALAFGTLRRAPPLLVFAGGLLGLLCLVALLAPIVSPYEPTAQSVVQRLKGPSALHWLGTDQFGRDVLSRIIYGMRASLAVSAAAVAAALLLGGTLGLTAAYFGGFVDRIVMRVMDVLFAFPVMLLAIGIIAVMGPGATTTATAIAIVYTPIFARLLRGPALVIATSDYVMAARSVGASHARIIAWHILPNLASVVLVQTSLLMSTAILVEASLSFLGLGTQPPSPSLGTMLSEGRNFLMLSPWSAIFSGFAILLIAFALNLFGDVLRDTLDPRLRGER